MDDSLIELRNAGGDTATVSLHGAQLLSWRPAGEAEQLYASPLTPPAAGKSVRGGAPVCFPQFSDRGNLPKHGFARSQRWTRIAPPAAPPPADLAEAAFALDTTAAATPWPHACRLLLAVRLGPRFLELHLQAHNTGSTEFAFTGALHTYLAVDDVRHCQLFGLEGLAYEDALDGLAVKEEGGDPIAFRGEIDRVYRQVPGSLHLAGGQLPSRRVLQQGFTDTVVWNPGPDKATRLGDMPPADWTRMLCIEAAVVQHPVQLEPGMTWSGVQRLELPGAA